MKTILSISLFLTFTLLFGVAHPKEFKRDCSYCDEIKTSNTTQQGDMIAECRLKGICINWVELHQSYKNKTQSIQQTASKKDYLAYMHGEGILGIPDLKKAARGKNNLFAQELLAYMYWEGVPGLPRNYGLSAHWFREAGENGSIGSRYLLGLLYFYGKGVSQDYEESVYWLMRAANCGNNNAQYFLGLMYYTGKGVKKDYQMAYIWLKVASLFGNNKTVKMEETLKNKLSKSELAQAQHTAELIETRYKDKSNSIMKRLNRFIIDNTKGKEIR